MKILTMFFLKIKNNIIKYYREALEAENRPYVYFRLIVLLSVVFVVSAHWYLVDTKTKYRVGYPAPVDYYAVTETNYFDKEATQKLRDEVELRIARVMVREGDSNSKLLENIKLIESGAFDEVFPPELSDVIRQKSKREQNKLLSVATDLLRNLSLTDSDEVEQSKAIWQALDKNKRLTQPEKNIVFQMCDGLIVSTYEADPQLLENLRKNVSKQVPLIRRHFEPGDLLVAKGTIITRELRNVLAYNGFPEANFPLVLLIITVFIVYFWTFIPIWISKKVDIIMPMNKWLYIASMLTVHWVLELVANQITVYRCFSLVGLASFFFLTLEPQLAYNLVLGSGVLSMLLFFKLDSCLIAIVCASIGYFLISGARSLERRSIIWLKVVTLSLLVSAIHILLVLPLSAMDLTLRLVAVSLLSAFFWGTWVVAGLPIVENVFGILTPSKLLELSSITQPVLKQLQIEAPGTYNHTLSVANLAETVAEQLGLDTLLVRVGAIFHDIGKLKCPAYFVENQQKDSNVHDDLSPVISAKILTSHVKNGYDMAKELRLPPEVCNLILQHHGTTFLSYFYEKAVALNLEVDKKDFTYPGPKPQSKEAALLMIVDSVEAALKGDNSKFETKDDLYRFINKIITSKVDAAQFDRVDFTLKDLTKICQLLTESCANLNYSRHVKSIDELVAENVLQKEVLNANKETKTVEAQQVVEDAVDEI